MQFNITDNYVLVYPDEDYTKHGGFEISDAFDPARRWAVTGKVLAIPNRLCFYEKVVRDFEGHIGKFDAMTEFIQKSVHYSVEFKQELKMSVGDSVVFSYIAHADDVLIDVGMERLALLIKYDMLYFVNESLINGWVFVEPTELVQQDLQEKFKGLDCILKDETKPGFGIVRKMAEPTKYILGQWVDDKNIQVGDMVFFRNTNNVPIEWNTHKTLNEGKYAFYKMQRKDILAVIKKNM